MSKATDHTEDGQGRQTVRDLIEYLKEPDLAEDLCLGTVLDLPVLMLTSGLNSEYRSILSTYLSTEDDGTVVMCIDIGE